jgi:hypothetical protein
MPEFERASQQFRQAAERKGMTIEQYALSELARLKKVDEPCDSGKPQPIPRDVFLAALEYTLAKNDELYRRLAKR